MYKLTSGRDLPKNFKMEVTDQNMFNFLLAYLRGKGYRSNFHRSVIFARYIEVNNEIIIDFEDYDDFSLSSLNRVEFLDNFELIEIEDENVTTPISSKLKNLLDNISQEEFDNAWEEIKNLRLKGPTIEEYLKTKTDDQSIA